jgi:hypothetical protein
MVKHEGTSKPRALRIALFLLLITVPGYARPISTGDVPEPLKPWVPWVLDQLGEDACPLIDQTHICVWPGVLDLTLDEHGGRFSQRIFADRESWLLLPGSREAWPMAVDVDGRTAVVLEHDGKPAVRVPAGTATVSGQFEWLSLPELLAVPDSIGLIQLSLGGTTIAVPKRDEQGRLWLGSTTQGTVEAEQLELEVFRKIEDGVPLIVTTRLVARSSGKPREVDLGPVLLANTSPLALKSDAPARLEQSGHLRLQVRPGTQQIEIRARVIDDATTLAPPKLPPPWPTREIWVWEPKPELRQVDLGGAVAIDPSRTSLDDDWKSLVTYSLDAHATLTLTTTRRGQPETRPNQLGIHRKLWLDLNGKGFTVQDRIGGQMHGAWRLDLADGQLGRVVSNGTPALITVNPATSEPGVELRDEAIDVVADFRLDREGARLPAVGWSENVERLHATLNVPPGWELIAATGVDDVPGTWLSSWNLFSFFFVLIVALAVTKLSRSIWGGVALLGLVLAHGQVDAPEWSWVAVLVFAALLQVLPASWFRGLIRLGAFVSAAVLVVLLLSFFVLQARGALYPQAITGAFRYEPTEASYDEPPEKRGEEAKAKRAAEPAPNAQAVKENLELTLQGIGTLGSGMLGGSGSIGSTRSDSAARDKGAANTASLNTQEPEAPIQTGPGIPNWRWRAWELNWSGPVEKSESLKLYFIGPVLGGCLAFLRIGLLGLLAFILFKATPWGSEPPSALRGPRPNRRVAPAASEASATSIVLRRARLISSVLFVSTALALLLAAPRASAQFPDEKLLAELKARLVREDDCGGECASVSKLELFAEEDRLRITGEVHAGKTTVYRLPGPTKAWLADRVSVDGMPSNALRAGSNGFLLLRLSEGKHTVEIGGPLIGNELTLDVGNPKRIKPHSDVWTFAGVRSDGQVEGTIQLQRKLDVQKTDTLETSDLPPWLEITRTIQVGTRWSIETRVRRVSAPGAPVVARLELLPGEAISQANAIVENGRLLISLGRDDTELKFESTLAPTERVTLKAPSDVAWSEVWEIACGVIHRCTARGLAPVRTEVGGQWRPLYRPWPGETLTVEFPRPQPAAGNTITVESAALLLTPGSRLNKGNLSLSIRSSHGGAETITLPASAQLEHLTIDGAEQPPVRDGQKLIVPLEPGSRNIELEWQEAGGINLLQYAPKVQLGTEAVNVEVTIRLPSDRWLLFAGGPSWGPAIVFWGYVVLLVLASFVLGRLPLSPLPSWKWLLLGLGLTQLPAPFVVLVAGWFFAFGFRGKDMPERRWQYNLIQLGLVLWTTLFLGTLASAIYSDLVIPPDMQVMGSDSTSSELKWYVDRVTGDLPTPWVLSTSIWVWRIAMLFWALWLAQSLIGWLKWGYQNLTQGGGWRKAPPRPVSPPPSSMVVPLGASPSNVPPVATSPNVPPEAPAIRGQGTDPNATPAVPMADVDPQTPSDEK